MKKLDRREFLRLSSLAGAATFLSPYTSLASDLGVLGENEDYKALVCIMLSGGNDSFNMLVPINDKSFKKYKKSRSNLALKENSLHRINFTDQHAQSFGLHPAMSRTKSLFNQQKLSFVANIGTLVKPISKQEYFNNSVHLPLGLMSHADQLRHWLTSVPNERLNYGIGGRIADMVQKYNKNHEIPMNISLSGSNYFQQGLEATEYAITQNGSVGLNINEKRNILDKTLYESFNNMLDRQYSDSFKQTYMDILKDAQGNHDDFKKATKDTKISTPFSDSQLSQELKMVAKTMASAKKLGMKRQTFYVLYHGWDHHDELLNSQEKMLSVLDNALYEFYEALDEKGLSKNAITFTASDFGRSLTSNGNGTDHAWGGNSIIMGDAIKGGQVFGDYPSLHLGSSLDVGGGVLIPTLSTDQLYEKLLEWYDISNANLGKILPNLANFKKSENQLDFLK
ncbi:MAG: DUF1501 domain-containing protein [Flavobacteriales bacterium]|jgi:uncharacterized protein (DUF1501 family)|nr:DUF1501 domain-containing protein [Flavobacteriales bacterium]